MALILHRIVLSLSPEEVTLLTRMFWKSVASAWRYPRNKAKQERCEKPVRTAEQAIATALQKRGSAPSQIEFFGMVTNMLVFCIQALRGVTDKALPLAKAADQGDELAVKRLDKMTPALMRKYIDNVEELEKRYRDMERLEKEHSSTNVRPLR